MQRRITQNAARADLKSDVLKELERHKNVFLGYRGNPAISEQALFRVTRDADFEVSDDADDLLEAVESELRRRRFGDVIRVDTVDGGISRMRVYYFCPEALTEFAETLNLPVQTHGYHL